MHIPDGVLSVPVLVGGALLTAGGLAHALPKVTESALPRVALVSAAFFVASLINVPVGPTSVHLVLSGPIALVLGWAAVPAVFVGLVLQAIFFGFGGLTALGVTTFTIAMPGIFWATVFQRAVIGAPTPVRKGAFGALVAALSIMTSALLVVSVLGLSDSAYLPAAPFVLLTYVPLMIGEALIAGPAIAFLARVRPDILGGGGSGR